MQQIISLRIFLVLILNKKYYLTFDKLQKKKIDYVNLRVIKIFQIFRLF